MNTYPKRVPGCPQLKLMYDEHYIDEQGLPWPVMQHRSCPGLVVNYLHRSLWVIRSAIRHYPRLFAVRIDLRFPDGLTAPGMRLSNKCLKRFFYHLEWELEQSHLTHPTRLFYLWAREQLTASNPHYHMVLMLNRDAISSVGQTVLSPGGQYAEQNLFHRIARAWQYALDLPSSSACKGLIHVAKDPLTQQIACAHVRSGHISEKEEAQRLVYMTSYLCKQYSKPFGAGSHCFGSSR